MDRSSTVAGAQHARPSVGAAADRAARGEPYDVVAEVLGRSRLPQVLIVHHRAARLDPLDGHTLGLASVPTGSVAHDLVLSFYEGAPRDRSSVSSSIAARASTRPRRRIWLRGWSPSCADAAGQG
jgi:hypothetical protein